MSTAYQFPPVTLLKKNQSKRQFEENKAAALEDAGKISELFSSHGISGMIININIGPNHIQYEWKLDPGQSVSKIRGLSEDLKLILGSMNVEFEIPTVGRNTVGITIPRETKELYLLRDIIESDEFKNASGGLNFAVGCSLQGKPLIGDLSAMPHMLAAGTTGSGKSVFIDSMITSMLYKYTPDDLKLILIDTKRSDFRLYQGLPHLIGDVLYTAKDAFGAFEYLLTEMKRRYDKMDAVRVRSVREYNRTASEKIPSIVVFIDDIADLMMYSDSETEYMIQRLTLQARAAGIHFVLVTQSPTARILTGDLTYNFISRAAFRTADGTQSRVITGLGGAEKLCGEGDMLFYQTGYPSYKRVQGAFISTGELNAVMDYIRKEK